MENTKKETNLKTDTETNTEADPITDPEMKTDTNSETRTEFKMEPVPETDPEHTHRADKPQTQEQKFLRYALLALFAGITIYLLFMVLNLWVTP